MNKELLQLVTVLVQLAVMFGPELVKDGELVIKLLTSGQDPTADELAEIKASYDAAYKKLQDAIAAKLQSPLDVPAPPAGA